MFSEQVQIYDRNQSMTFKASKTIVKDLKKYFNDNESCEFDEQETNSFILTVKDLKGNECNFTVTDTDQFYSFLSRVKELISEQVVPPYKLT